MLSDYFRCEYQAVDQDVEELQSRTPRLDTRYNFHAKICFHNFVCARRVDVIEMNTIGKWMGDIKHAHFDENRFYVIFFSI